METKNTHIKAANAKKYVITSAEGVPIKGLEIAGLPIKVTSENVNDPNVLKAVANYEARHPERKIIGVHIRLQ
jgi:hypothetical protein